MGLPTQYSTKCSDLVKVSEGLRLKVYLDTAGNPTIAYGHKLRAGESFSNGIDVPTACVLLSQDLSTAAAAVGRLVKVPLTQGQIDALVDFVFNLGALLLANSTLLRYLNNGDYENAAFQLKLWDHGRVAGKEVELAALKARRKAELVLWNS